MYNMDFDSQRRFAGSAPLADMGSEAIDGDNNLNFQVGPVTSGDDDGWQVVWAYKAEENLTGLWTFMQANDDRGRFYLLGILDLTQLYLAVIGDGVTNDLFIDISGGELDITQWNMFRIKVTPDGANVDVGVGWSQEGSGENWGAETTFAGQTNRPAGGGLAAGGAGAMPGSTWGHVAVFQNDDHDFGEAEAHAALNGRSGELVEDRFARLMTEEGIPYEVRGDGDDTGAMGPQKAGTLSSELRIMRDTDDGMIFDAKDELGLVFRTRQDLYSQTPKLELTFGVDVAYPFVEVLDDLSIHNIMAVQNRDRGSYEVEETAGPLSTQPPPDGIGESKGAVDVSVQDEAELVQLAWWNLNRQTVETPRFPTVTVDLVANPELEADVAAIDVGDRIRVADYFPDDVDLMVIGWTDRTGSHTRKVTFVTVPYRQFDVGVYTADAGPVTTATKRYDSATSTLNTSYAAGAATMVVTFTDLYDQWSQTAEPYDWEVAGERITVTAMGAVSGSGPYTQSATVTRAVNGVSKAQASGATVRMHSDQQARYAL
jgi:hypothetical protein